MSTHIQMDEEYIQLTTYYGKLNDEHSFVVELLYNSEIKNHNITSIEFIEGKEGKSDMYWNKAENKIRDFVMKWLFDRSEDE